MKTKVLLLTIFVGCAVAAYAAKPSATVAIPEKFVGEKGRQSRADTDPVINTGATHDAFSDDYSAFIQVKHGQWLRSWAGLHLGSGRLVVKLCLETDNNLYGVAGFTEVILRDINGRDLKHLQMKPCAIPSKTGGKARVQEFSGEFTVSQDLLNRLSSITVLPHCTHDSEPLPLGLKSASVEIVDITF